MQYPGVTTKLVILLGNPLGHSVSPPMHNRVFEVLGLDYCYLPVEVVSENLQVVFAGLCKMNVAGFNVTIPHKIDIIKHLDELDPLAATIGAVNTICLKYGKATGYNTDGEGFVLSLEQTAETSVEGKTVFLLGCGGAARAIAMTMAFRGAERIYIHNRTRSKAEQLVNEINNRIRSCSDVVADTFKEKEAAAARSNILINSTSLGMHPHSDALPIEASLIAPHLIVADIVYNPLTTKLLKIARERGCTIVPGLGMLIYQGAAAFRLFTGVEPLINEMSETAYSLMKAKH